MDTRRHIGFVVGSDPAPKGQWVWKVRIKDPASPHNGQKIVVASVRNNIALARGLNVNFAIGTMDDPSGVKVLRAVDVCLETTGGEMESHKHRSGGQE